MAEIIFAEIYLAEYTSMKFLFRRLHFAGYFITRKFQFAENQIAVMPLFFKFSFLNIKMSSPQN